MVDIASQLMSSLSKQGVSRRTKAGKEEWENISELTSLGNSLIFYTVSEDFVIESHAEELFNEEEMEHIINPFLELENINEEIFDEEEMEQIMNDFIEYISIEEENAINKFLFHINEPEPQKTLEEMVNELPLDVNSLIFRFMSHPFADIVRERLIDNGHNIILDTGNGYIFIPKDDNPDSDGVDDT